MIFKREVICALCFLVACLWVSPASAERTLRVTLQIAITNILGQNIQAFKELVEERSDGTITIEIYPSAQLYKDKEVPQAVASGAIEMGIASVTRFVGTRPAVDVFSVPFLFEDSNHVAEAVAPGHPVRDMLDQEILSTGARVLWWQPFGLSVMLGKKDPLIAPADLADKKVRVFGKLQGEFVLAAGGAPTLMSGSEQFMAYQRGTVDFGITAIPALQTRRLYEVMPYLTLSNHSASEFVVLINDDLWAAMTDDERALLTAAAREVETNLRQSYDAYHQLTVNWILENTDMTVNELSDDQRAAWRSFAAPVQDIYVKAAGTIGARLIEEVQKLR